MSDKECKEFVLDDKEREEFVCDYCGTELDETDEYHTTFRTCDEDCYMKMVGLSWSDFISHY